MNREALRRTVSLGVYLVSGSFLPGLGVHSWNASVRGYTLHHPHAIIELLHPCFQPGAADQLSAAREDCCVHDLRSVGCVMSQCQDSSSTDGKDLGCA